MGSFGVRGCECSYSRETFVQRVRAHEIEADEIESQCGDVDVGVDEPGSDKRTTQVFDLRGGVQRPSGALVADPHDGAVGDGDRGRVRCK